MVAVEETPAQHIHNRGETFQCGSDHNIAASGKDRCLSSCFHEPYGDVHHKLLAHNHIMSILRAFPTRAKWELPPDHERQLFCCDADGR